MERIRVIQLIEGLETEQTFGGAELFAIRLACNLDKSRFSVALVALWGYGRRSEQRWIDLLRNKSVCTVVLDRARHHSIENLLRSLRSFWGFVTEFRPHIINSHSERADLVNALLGKLHPLRPRIVRTMHTDQQWQRSPWFGTVFLNLLCPFLFDAEIAISKTVQEVLDRRWVARIRAKKSLLCYNGVDLTELLSPYTSNQWTDFLTKLRKCGPVIGTIGRLSQQKGHCDLLEAMTIVLSRRKDVNLVIIGSGPLETSLKRQCDRLGISPSVHWLGYCDDAFRLLPLLDLFVLSSWWEGFPTVLLESMAVGVPVVATDVSGSRELIKEGETGLLVPPRNPKRLAQAILRVLDNPTEAKVHAENAKGRASQFTIENAAKCYAQIYEKLVAS
jgi:glycosyltransferase involved in cell wall biosynthesis